MMECYYIPETTSTNELLKSISRKEDKPEGFFIYTDHQTSGKGQGINRWESKKGKNILFSTLLFPNHIQAAEQFIISQIVSVAILEVLSDIIPNVKIKWPNDIYVEDRKIAGILIENTIQGSIINKTIIGIGLNVNQTEFTSYAPNPVSLKLITKKSSNRHKLMERIIEKILENYYDADYEIIRMQYFNKLYRNDGYYPYSGEGETFRAMITEVLNDGRLVLLNKEGETKIYGFKEVEFIINP